MGIAAMQIDNVLAACENRMQLLMIGGLSKATYITKCDSLNGEAKRHELRISVWDTWKDSEWL